MMRNLIVVWTIAVVSGICAGILFSTSIFNQFHVFGIFSYVVFAMILALVLVLGIILCVVAGRRIGGISTIFAIIMVCTATMTSKVTNRIAGRSAIKLANKMIANLYAYRDEHGRFPDIIDSIKTDLSDIKKFKNTQTYIFDRQLSAFRIYSWNDGWYFHVYRSSDSSWHQEE